MVGCGGLVFAVEAGLMISLPALQLPTTTATVADPLLLTAAGPTNRPAVTAADQALLAAKRAGRNRLHVALTSVPAPRAARPEGDLLPSTQP